MDEFETTAPETQDEYRERPRWQVWAARAGVAFMILLTIWQCVQMAWGLF